MNNNKTVLDLFCGCGGLSSGFSKAGYDVVLGIDHWRDAIDTFLYNHPNSRGLVADLLHISPKEIAKEIKTNYIDLIIGGPPCQGFSIAGKKIIDDDRNKLYKSFVSFVNYFKPKAFLMENVPNILSMGSGIVRDNIINEFEALGYNVTYEIMLASDFGVPQNRKRAFFIGILDGSKFEFPKGDGSNIITSKEAISDLPRNSLLDGSLYPLEAQSDYQLLMRINSKKVYNHEITNHNDKTIEIISMVPDGGNYKNLPIELQNTRKVNIAWTRLNSQKPSFTIDTGHNHHFHYEYNRVPTARESARLQSFPDDYIFLKGKTSQLKQIGNAVPPKLAEIIAKNLINYI